MAITAEQPEARSIFRKIALGVAVFCFVLAGAFGIALDDNKPLAVITSLMVGFVMMTIARTGLWPPPGAERLSA
jgi:hypothetical protein